MMTTDVKNPRGRNEDVPRGRGQIIRKHVLRSIQRNNKRVRNAVHVEHGKCARNLAAAAVHTIEKNPPTFFSFEVMA